MTLFYLYSNALDLLKLQQLQKHYFVPIYRFPFYMHISKNLTKFTMMWFHSSIRIINTYYNIRITKAKLPYLLMWTNFSSSFNKALLPPLWKCTAGYVVPSFNMKIMYAQP